MIGLKGTNIRLDADSFAVLVIACAVLLGCFWGRA